MNRAEVLQEVRLMKFEDVYSQQAANAHATAQRAQNQKALRHSTYIQHVP